jgi:hypothetical protein
VFEGYRKFLLLQAGLETVNKLLQTSLCLNFCLAVYLFLLEVLPKQVLTIFFFVGLHKTIAFLVPFEAEFQNVGYGFWVVALKFEIQNEHKY